MQADAFAVNLGYAKDLRPALVKLQVREDSRNQNTDCLYSSCDTCFNGCCFCWGVFCRKRTYQRWTLIHCTQLITTHILLLLRGYEPLMDRTIRQIKSLKACLLYEFLTVLRSVCFEHWITEQEIINLKILAKWFKIYYTYLLIKILRNGIIEQDIQVEKSNQI